MQETQMWRNDRDEDKYIWEKYIERWSLKL